MTQKERFERALSRLDYFGAPRDDCTLYVDSDETLYEMLDRSEAVDGPDEINQAKQLTLGDLRKLLQELSE